MTNVTIRLDKSKPHSECRGERTPDDPHYRVSYWQGQQIGKKMVLLPFDAEGVLVQPDKDRTEPYAGLNVEGKPVTHQPLYNKDMLDLLERKVARLSAASAPVDDEESPSSEHDEEEEISNAAEDVNFGSWLRGEARYQPHLLRTAAKKRFSKNYPMIKELVVDLVLDEKIVREDEVCAELRVYLPKAA